MVYLEADTSPFSNQRSLCFSAVGSNRNGLTLQGGILQLDQSCRDPNCPVAKGIKFIRCGYRLGLDLLHISVLYDDIATAYVFLGLLPFDLFG